MNHKRAVVSMGGADLKLLNENQVEELYGINKRTLQRMRIDGTGPQFVKIRRRVYYRPQDLNSYIESNIRHSTQDTGHSPRKLFK